MLKNEMKATGKIYISVQLSSVWKTFFTPENQNEIFSLMKRKHTHSHISTELNKKNIFNLLFG